MPAAIEAAVWAAWLLTWLAWLLAWLAWLLAWLPVWDAWLVLVHQGPLYHDPNAYWAGLMHVELAQLDSVKPQVTGGMTGAVGAELAAALQTAPSLRVRDGEQEAPLVV